MLQHDRAAAAGLGRDATVLLWVSLLFTVANLLSSTFVNIYIWRVDHSYVPVAVFNLANFIATPLMFVLAGWLVKYSDRVWVLRAGVAALIAFYIVVLLVGEASARHALWLGLLLGMGGGLYWLAFNLLSLELTHEGSRHRFNGLNGILGSIAGMIAPLFAGWIIARMADYRGYHLLFASSGCLFAGAVAVSFGLAKHAAKGRYAPLFVYRRHDPDWWKLMWASLFYGTREGVLAFFIGLLVFLVTKTELGLGKFALLTSGVSLLTFFVAGRACAKSASRSRWLMLLGAGVMALGALILSVRIGYLTLICFGVLTSIGSPFFLVPFSTMIFNEIDENHEARALRVEYIVMREVFLNIGRILSILAFLAVWAMFASTFALRIFLVFIGSMQLLSWILARSTAQRREQRRVA